MKHGDMVKVIKKGGSVLHQGKVLSRLEELPSEADLAKGDAEEALRVRGKLLEQRKHIDQELAKVGAPAEGQEGRGRPDEPTGDERLKEAVQEIYRLQKVVGERNEENDKLRQELQTVSRDRDELKALLDAATSTPQEDKPEDKPDTKAARKGK